ncbi:hypothetical protein ACS0TY_026341 [Phlomoides rotata]
MSRANVYDNWDRLVGAVLKRDELRRLALCDSLSSSITDDISLGTSIEDAPSSSRQSQTFDIEVHSSQWGRVQQMDFNEIKKATKNFRPMRILAQGFSLDCKGWIDEHSLTASMPGCGTAVVVKCNAGCLQELQEWLKEIKYFSQLHHPNLVRFIGYCLEEEKMVTVYEFMDRGSLDCHLYRGGSKRISWETRIKVAKDAARGLSFLHERDLPVIHRNIQTANILLDEDLNAKLTNYGLARDGGNGDMSGVLTKVVGAHCYAAPEYMATGWSTTNCDVYSFGVVLLELLSGRQVHMKWLANEQNLVEWTKPCLTDKQKLLRIMDISLVRECPDKAAFKVLEVAAYKVAKLAFRCLSSDPNLRPRMDEVVVALQLI